MPRPPLRPESAPNPPTGKGGRKGKDPPGDQGRVLLSPSAPAGAGPQEGQSLSSASTAFWSSSFDTSLSVMEASSNT